AAPRDRIEIPLHRIAQEEVTIPEQIEPAPPELKRGRQHARAGFRHAPGQDEPRGRGQGALEETRRGGLAKTLEQLLLFSGFGPGGGGQAAPLEPLQALLTSAVGEAADTEVQQALQSHSSTPAYAAAHSPRTLGQA